MSAGDRDSTGVRALRGYSVVDGGDVVGTFELHLLSVDGTRRGDSAAARMGT